MKASVRFLFAGFVFVACATKVPAGPSPIETKYNELQSRQTQTETMLREMSHQMMLMQAKLEHMSLASSSKKEIASVPIVSSKVESPAPSLLELKETETHAKKIRLTNDSLKKLKPLPEISSNAEVKKSPEAEKEYTDAYRVFEGKNYPLAVEKLQSFVAKYPQHSYSDNAAYWIAESHYRQKKYDLALLGFIQVLEKYPNGNKIPDSMLKIGLSYKELGRLMEARETLEKIQEKYPGTVAAKQAKVSLDGLQNGER